MLITILSHKSITHKIKSPRRQALPPYRWQHFKCVWALKFLIDEPWRGGAQTVNLRETEVMGKREEESEKGERRKKGKIKKKSAQLSLGIKK